MGKINYCKRGNQLVLNWKGKIRTIRIKRSVKEDENPAGDGL
jgi:hypothetical protein